MMALSPHFSLVTKWIASWSSKSGKPQGVVISALQLCFEKMGRSRGLEPPTPGTTNQCSNQLSYDRHEVRAREHSRARGRHLGSEAMQGKRPSGMARWLAVSGTSGGGRGRD